MKDFLRSMTPFVIILLLVLGANHCSFDFLGLATQFKDFMLGNIGIHEGVTNIPHVIGDVVGVVIFTFLICTIAAFILFTIMGLPRSHVASEILKRKGEYSILTIFVIVAGEELFARWIFLGVLTKIPFLNGVIAFFVLMVLGNLIWSLIHLYNFQDEEERNPLRVLPQFLAGFLFTFIFVKYGIFVAILAHFTFDAVLFSAGKCDDVSAKDLFYILYFGVALLITYGLMSAWGLKIADLKPWLSTTALSPLSGYNFWGYLVVFLVVSSFLELIAAFLFMDRTNPYEVQDKPPNLALMLFVGPPLAILVVYFFNWFCGLFAANIFVKLLSVAIVLVCLPKRSSMSAVSRAWLVGLPGTFLFVMAVLTLDFWTACGLLYLSMLISLPVEIAKRLD